MAGLISTLDAGSDITATIFILGIDSHDVVKVSDEA